MTNARRIFLNVASSVPGVSRVPIVRDYLAKRRLGTRGTDSARYCYSVWMRHLVKAFEAGLEAHPRTIAELGPGDSLGAGIAALLTGAHRYYAFDVVEHASVARNVQILHELTALFRTRAAIPDAAEFPQVHPSLGDYAFPRHLLPDQAIDAGLAPSRLGQIVTALMNTTRADSPIQYRVPWYDSGVVEPGSVDMIFSQAVLEHVDDLPSVYRAMNLWLRPGGFMSHEIDFKSHGFAREWNGHWAHSDFMWGLIRGRDSWLINREPRSTHLRLLEREGFRIVRHETVPSPSSLRRRNLAARFRNMPEDDLTTRSAFLQAVKT